MTPQQQKRIGRFLSLLLRHRPEILDLDLDQQGWTDVDTLLHKLSSTDKAISREELDLIVAENPKKRYAFNDDKSRIRAQQGHSVTVDLAYEPSPPPEYLYHGTVSKFVGSIRSQGLQKGKRHHVHLSPDRDTAINVGQRRGKPVILTIRAGAMHRAGYPFYVSGNGVWLADEIPPEFIEN
ncbi:MAG: RNA 2'-phosphotransferase [Bacteroidota bacterium]